jgi:hypothetical protein
METRNAVITNAVIVVSEHGVLNARLLLDCGDENRIFGCGLYKAESGIDGLDYAGRFIYRVLQTVGVDEWAQLRGKAVRIKGDSVHVDVIGHIVTDVWFNPDEEFKLTQRTVPF